MRLLSLSLELVGRGSAPAIQGGIHDRGLYRGVCAGCGQAFEIAKHGRNGRWLRNDRWLRSARFYPHF